MEEAAVLFEFLELNDTNKTFFYIKKTYHSPSLYTFFLKIIIIILCTFHLISFLLDSFTILHLFLFCSYNAVYSISRKVLIILLLPINHFCFEQHITFALFKCFHFCLYLYMIFLS